VRRTLDILDICLYAKTFKAPEIRIAGRVSEPQLSVSA
jgi:hypothetical protein